MVINDHGPVSCTRPSGNTFSRAGVVLGQTSNFTFVLQQGRQRVERGAYLCTEGELLI